jgi:tryptophan synthase alpha chain
VSRIEPTFANVKLEGRAAFMPFLTAGDPDLATSRRILVAMAEAGADLIEVGVPFSDPLADGPTIQQAYERALATGTTLGGVLQMVKEARRQTEVPILLMGSYNPVFIYGVEQFCADAAEAGVDGLIIPDLLPELATELSAPAKRAGLDMVFLIAPTSTDARLRQVASASTGFVYAVSLTGVTGERQNVNAALGPFLERARAAIDLPIAVGFGIGTPQMAKGVAELADGVIIGSAIVKRIAAAVEAGEDPAEAAASFTAEVAEALRG